MPLFTSPTTPLDSLLDRPRPGPWEQFLSNPCIFLARKLYTWYQAIPATPLTKPISIVCVSDTHNSQPKLPEGDILIHAGDLTQSGSLAELRSSVNWLRTQSHPIKVVIAGNHDFLLDASRDNSSSSSDKAAAAAAAAASERESIDWGDIIYLENKETTITCPNGRNLRIYGSPFSPRHGNWAFQYPRGYDIWSSIRIPEGIDILVTHAPPRAHLDLLGLGCVYLLRALWRVRPRVHVFGHVHEGAGVEWVLFDRLQE
ncbi:Calcineurin-like phosphoesterase, partial [Aspergillus sclerotialis]